MADAIRQAREAGIAVLASVTGTQEDPQGLARQAHILRSVGVEVCDSNAAAARLAGMIVARLQPATTAKGR